jgi:ferredoxin
MKVWIDQNRCTGSGLCELIEPEVFLLADNGLAQVQQNGQVLPPGPDGLASVPADCVNTVLEAERGCPGGCIQIVDDD